MKIGEIIDFIENLVPVAYQENYDNSGLQIGNRDDELNQAIIALDINEKIINEAVEKKCNLILSHHPLLFHGIKKITNSTPIERIISIAIKNNISIYSIHTNFDNSIEGHNFFVAKILGLENIKILRPVENALKKLVVFCPIDHADKIRQALFDAGAGHIGNYDSCSFNINGTGSFKANEDANPYVGEINKLHFENEVRIETIFPKHIQKRLINAMLQAHPYEEVAYDIYPLDNAYNKVGAGIIGDIPKEIDVTDFLNFLKSFFKSSCLRYNKPENIKIIKKVAFCGGSGKFLIDTAIAEKADIFITSDLTYHDFQNDKIILVDPGHFETEQFACELLAMSIKKKFPNFAFTFSENNTNPVNYL